MRKLIVTITFIFYSLLMVAQTSVSGIVTDAKGNPIEGANIYLEGTYDGASSDSEGKFSFETSETGTQNLIVSMISYDTYMQAGDISYLKDLNIQFLHHLFLLLLFLKTTYQSILVLISCEVKKDQQTHRF